MNKKAALVTGASHGIGQSIAIELAKSGYSVGINYCRNEKGAQHTLDEIKKVGGHGIIIKGSVADNDELASVFEAFYAEFGTIDLMVNNAGITKFYPLLEVTEDQWKEITFTDWKGAFFGTQFAARKMVEQKKPGLIINISSNHVDGCWPKANIYAPTKAALTKFGRNAAMELAPYGIRVITVAPGYTDVGWDKDDPIYEVPERLPLKRFATPEEVSRVIAYVASDDCAYMTGNCITIDGGALLPIIPENDLGL